METNVTGMARRISPPFSPNSFAKD